MKLGLAAAAAFVATVVLANWTLERYGIVTLPGGLTVPAGVVWAGLAFSLRDLTREQLGPWSLVPCIALGAALSWYVGDGYTVPGGLVTLALASGVAFLVSETADAVVYEPLRRRGQGRALAASNVVGSLVDSALFLWLAFGSLTHIAGQVIVKWLVILPCLLALWGWRATQTGGADDLVERRTSATGDQPRTPRSGRDADATDGTQGGRVERVVGS